MRRFFTLWGRYCRETAEVAAVMVIVTAIVVIGMIVLHHVATVSVPAMVAILGPWWSGAFGLAGLLSGAFLVAGLVAAYNAFMTPKSKRSPCRPN